MIDQTHTHRPKPVFPPGRVVATQGAVEAVTPDKLAWFIDRHLSGDWGCVCAEDKVANDYALKHGGRILSAYAIDPDEPCAGFGANTLWIITEADNSVTTLLLPDEY